MHLFLSQTLLSLLFLPSFLQKSHSFSLTFKLLILYNSFPDRNATFYNEDSLIILSGSKVCHWESPLKLKAFMTYLNLFLLIIEIGSQARESALLLVLRLCLEGFVRLFPGHQVPFKRTLPLALGCRQSIDNGFQVVLSKPLSRMITEILSQIDLIVLIKNTIGLLDLPTHAIDQSDI